MGGGQIGLRIGEFCFKSSRLAARTFARDSDFLIFVSSELRIPDRIVSLQSVVICIKVFQRLTFLESLQLKIFL